MDFPKGFIYDPHKESVYIKDTVTEVCKLINAIFDNLPVLACITDNVHNDFIYTNKFAEDLFISNEENEEKIFNFAQIGKRNDKGEKAEFDGRPFLLYTTKLKLLDEKILNFVIGIENIDQKRSYAGKKAGIDSVSGAYNQAYAIAGLDGLSLKSEIEGTIFSICYMDINGLNKINMRYGNEAGDNLLKRVVEVTKNNTRRSDYIARMENDEFLLILPDCNTVTANKIMKNISDTIYDEFITNLDISGYFITYGILEGNKQRKKSAEDLIEAAKNQMEKNKHTHSNYDNKQK